MKISWRLDLQVKNCAKTGNSKYSTINQMSYIQKFFDQHLPRFYLEEVRQRFHQPQFLLFNNQHNIFDLTLDLILSSQSCLQSNSRSQNVPVLALLCKISYEELRQVRLPAKQQDNDIVKILKTSLKYVHMQMFQILIRLVLCFYQSLNTRAFSDTLSTLVEQIALIYPALKIQISFSHPEINLCDFFEKYLTKITQFMPLNDVSKLLLQKIADKGQFIGPLEKLFKKYTQINTKSSFQRDLKPIIPQNNHQLVGKEPKTSNFVSLEENKKSHRMSSHSDQKQQKFDDLQLFRSKKRKLITKQRLKSSEGGNKTPCRQSQMSHPNTPKTSKTQQLFVRSDTTQNNPSSILYRRLLTKKAHPVPERTLYFGQIHKFIPKKTSKLDPQLYIQSITASSLTTQYSNPYEQAVKKTQRKVSKYMTQENEENRLFYVPQTPKKDLLRKQSSNVMKAFKP